MKVTTNLIWYFQKVCVYVVVDKQNRQNSSWLCGDDGSVVAGYANTVTATTTWTWQWLLWTLKAGTNIKWTIRQRKDFGCFYIPNSNILKIFKIPCPPVHTYVAQIESLEQKDLRCKISWHSPRRPAVGFCPKIRHFLNEFFFILMLKDYFIKKCMGFDSPLPTRHILEKCLYTKIFFEKP